MRKISQQWLRWLLVPLLLFAAWAAWRSVHALPPPLQAQLAAAATLPQDTAGFARADGPQPLHFPADQGPHNDYQTEWWYYTGNLETASGAHFGYQLTFFRRALIPPSAQVARPSDWATDQVYMAHLTLTDVQGGRHYAYQQLSRGAAGLAGAQADPYRVWLDDWSVQDSGGDQVALQAAMGQVKLDLNLHSLKAPVLQGDAGYSPKGPQPGNASYYYSLTRIATEGTVTVGGQSYQVTGLSWMDHEYSTSALGPNEVGWDWFSLQLNDGSELMVFHLRLAGGQLSPFSSGTLIAPDGATRHLGPGDFDIQVTGHWRSPHTGATYPAGWVVSIPSAKLRLTVAPYLPDQENVLDYTYWEGAVRVQGERDGNPVAGAGYVELTGYAGSMQGQF